MGTGMLDREIGAGVGPGIPTASERQRARKWLQTRRDFGSHVVAFVVINAFLVGAWAFTGAGYFWPAWVLGCWGVGLVLHAGSSRCSTWWAGMVL